MHGTNLSLQCSLIEDRQLTNDHLADAFIQSDLQLVQVNPFCAELAIMWLSSLTRCHSEIGTSPAPGCGSSCAHPSTNSTHDGDAF